MWREIFKYIYTYIYINTINSIVNQVISQLSYLGGPDLVLVSMYVVLMGAQVQDALLHRLKMTDVP